MNGICGNVDYKAYPLKLVDATTLLKDGIGMCQLYVKIIDSIEARYKCTVTYFIIDADGGSLKGRKLLLKERPWLFAPSCFAHQVCIKLCCDSDYN